MTTAVLKPWTTEYCLSGGGLLAIISATETSRSMSAEMSFERALREA